MEMFSIWNNTAPTTDGSIGFTPFSLSGEWSSAAVYNLYTTGGSIAGKVLIQNNNDSISIALDCTGFVIEHPSVTSWGAAIYLDLNHDGLFSEGEHRIKYTYASGVEIVDLCTYSRLLSDWELIEFAGPGIPMTISGIVADTDYKRSAFNTVTFHRMYEFEIPYQTAMNDKIIGIGLMATDNFANFANSITWPSFELAF